MVLGYAYPAYECYKSVELNKPDIEQLRFWCQYWYISHLVYSSSALVSVLRCNLVSNCRVLVAGLTVFERFGDTLVGW